MNWPLALVIVACLAGTVFLWLQVKPFLHRALSTVEAKTTVTVEAARAQSVKPLERPPKPAMLLMIAGQESEQWARDQKLDWMNDLYDEYGSWQTVQTIAINEQASAIVRKSLN